MAVNRGGRFGPVRRGGRKLAPGHAVNIVVDDQRRQIYIAPGRMDKVVAADGGGVAVAHDHNDLELGIGQLDAGGEGEGPTMGGVQGIEIHINGHPPGAADAGDQDNVILKEAAAVNGSDQGPPRTMRCRTPDTQTWGNFLSCRRYL